MILMIAVTGGGAATRGAASSIGQSGGSRKWKESSEASAHQR